MPDGTGHAGRLEGEKEEKGEEGEGDHVRRARMTRQCSVR